MSSGSIKKGFQNFLFEDRYKEFFIGISNSKISFLSLAKEEKILDIYSDTKNIRFDELNLEFKKILMEEFNNILINPIKN